VTASGPCDIHCAPHPWYCGCLLAGLRLYTFCILHTHLRFPHYGSLLLGYAAPARVGPPHTRVVPTAISPAFRIRTIAHVLHTVYAHLPGLLLVHHTRCPGCSLPVTFYRSLHMPFGLHTVTLRDLRLHELTVCTHTHTVVGLV